MTNEEHNNAGLLSYGADLIKAERLRQIREEGWSAGHDDEHTQGEMRLAAVAYAYFINPWIHDLASGDLVLSEGVPPSMWPWEKEWYKPSKDPIRQLVKAGALIAAEIDRRNRAAITKAIG